MTSVLVVGFLVYAIVLDDVIECLNHQTSLTAVITLLLW